MDRPATRHVATLHVDISEPLMIGPVGHRLRAVVPITGGTIRGPEIRGEVVPGGFDWAWLSEDGSADVEAHYALKLDDGSYATIVNTGSCMPLPGAEDTFTGKAVPVFETGSETYAWLNTTQFICRFTSRMADGFVDLEVFAVD